MASGKPAYKGLGREVGGQAELHPREQGHWSGTLSCPAVMWTRSSHLWSGPCITPSLQGRSASKWGRLCTNQKTQQAHCKNTARPPGLVPPPASLPGSMPHGAQAGPPAHITHQKHTRSRLLRGRPSEAQFDIQKEVNHVLFMMKEANRTRITSPQISLNSSDTKTMASSPPLPLPLENSQDELNPESQGARHSQPVKKAQVPASAVRSHAWVPGPTLGPDTTIQTPKSEPSSQRLPKQVLYATKQQQETFLQGFRADGIG